MYNQALRQIANTLYINIQHIGNIGLLDGLTGPILFFYRYAKYIDNSIYEKLADELLEQVFYKLSLDIPLNFSNGLSGIAWGINYLASNHYIEIEENALEEIELLIYGMEVDKFESDMQAETPLFSKGIYALSIPSSNDLFLIQILKQVEEFLTRYTELILPLSYLNSLIYFILGCNTLSIQHSSLQTVLDMIYDKLLISIKGNSYSKDEKRNFHHLINLLINQDHLVNKKSKWLIDELKFEIMKQEDVNFTWLDLLLSKNELINLDLANKYQLDIGIFIKNKIQHSTNKDLTLQNGLAGVGFQLLE